MTSLLERHPRPSSGTPAAVRSRDDRMGLTQSTALIVGSIVGVGIFSLPYSLASYGSISLVAMLIASVGAIAFALLFAALSRRIPAEGGPYAYARSAFGSGFVTGLTTIAPYMPFAMCASTGFVPQWYM